MNSNKLSKFEYEEAIKTFLYIREGKQASFPMGFFNDEVGALKIKAIIEYYFYELNNFTESEAVQNFTHTLLKDTGLENAVRCVYGKKGMNKDLFELLFPNRKVWEVPVLPKGLWGAEMAKEFAIFVLEDVCGLTKETIFTKTATDIVNAIEGKEDFIYRSFRRFSGVCELIAMAYDMDKKEVKRKLPVKGYVRSAQVGRSKVYDTEQPKQATWSDVDECYAHLYMMYYLQKNGVLGCYLVGGETTEEVSSKASELSNEFGATKYWLEKL